MSDYLNMVCCLLQRGGLQVTDLYRTSEGAGFRSIIQLTKSAVTTFAAEFDCVGLDKMSHILCVWYGETSSITLVSLRAAFVSMSISPA